MFGLPIGFLKSPSPDLYPAALDPLDDPDVLARRRPVWARLSELWLDTELDQDSIRHITKTLYDSGYSDNNIYYIAFHEVGCVVAGNLFLVAGVWGMFDQEWLEDEITARWRRRAKHPQRALVPVWRGRIYRYFIREDWEKIMASLEACRASYISR